MQLDRRRLFSAGIGTSIASGIGASMLTIPVTAAIAQNRTPSSSNPSVLHAADLGLKPDTGRDDTARLQTAIDLAAAQRARLQLPAGRYNVRSLRLHSGSHIAGAGPATVLQHLGGPALLAGENLAGVTVSDLTVTGGFPVTDGPSHEGRRGLVEFRRTRNLALTALTIETATANGIMLERCSGRITECRIQDVAKAAIFSLDADGGIEISHNEITRIGNNGILV